MCMSCAQTREQRKRSGHEVHIVMEATTLRRGVLHQSCKFSLTPRMHHGYLQKQKRG